MIIPVSFHLFLLFAFFRNLLKFRRIMPLVRVLSLDFINYFIINRETSYIYIYYIVHSYDQSRTAGVLFFRYTAA